MIIPKALEKSQHYQYLEHDLGSFHIQGCGIAGIESVYHIPEWKLTLDIGRAPHFSCFSNVLALTHWHLDHAGGLAFCLGLRCLNSMPPLMIVVPDDRVVGVRTHLDQLKEISETQIHYQVRSAQEELMLKPDLALRGLESFHCTSSTGYGVYRQKKRLKSEYVGRSSKDIVDAKKSGVVVDEPIEEFEFAYSGDSRGEFMNTEANKAKVLLMECSFFSEDGDYEKIRKFGHTHIRDWAQWAESVESDTVIMTHTSQRYSLKEIKSACRKYLPKSFLDKLVLFRS